MAHVICPRCKRKTAELEVLGHCENCGHSAVSESGIQVEDNFPPDSKQSGAAFCAICGADGPLHPFYLRTFSVTNWFGQATRKWRDVPSECCAACYRRVSLLQSLKLVFTIAFCVLILLSPLLYVAGTKQHNPLLVGLSIPLGLVAVGSGMGLVVVGIWRRKIVNSPNLASLVDTLRAQHLSATDDSQVKVIPLATPSESIYL